MKIEKHLAPQSCYEIGNIYRRMGDFEPAKKWYKKSKSYSGYITESLIKFRIEYALYIIKSNELKRETEISEQSYK